MRREFNKHARKRQAIALTVASHDAAGEKPMPHKQAVDHKLEYDENSAGPMVMLR
jgi:hypothetical protein